MHCPVSGKQRVLVCAEAPAGSSKPKAITTTSPSINRRIIPSHNWGVRRSPTRFYHAQTSLPEAACFREAGSFLVVAGAGVAGAAVAAELPGELVLLHLQQRALLEDLVADVDGALVLERPAHRLADAGLLAPDLAEAAVRLVQARRRREATVGRVAFLPGVHKGLVGHGVVGAV